MEDTTHNSNSYETATNDIWVSDTPDQQFDPNSLVMQTNPTVGITFQSLWVNFDIEDKNHTYQLLYYRANGNNVVIRFKSFSSELFGDLLNKSSNIKNFRITDEKTGELLAKEKIVVDSWEFDYLTTSFEVRASF